MVEMIELVWYVRKNWQENEKNYIHQHFLLFPLFLPHQKQVKSLKLHIKMLSANAFNLNQSRIL